MELQQRELLTPIENEENEEEIKLPNSPIDKLPEWLQSIIYSVYWQIDDLKFYWKTDEDFKKKMLIIPIIFLLIIVVVLMVCDIYL